MLDWNRVDKAAQSANEQFRQFMPTRWVQYFVTAYNAEGGEDSAQIAILNERIKELMATNDEIFNIAKARQSVIEKLQAEIAQYKAMQGAPEACCGEFDTCDKPCTPRGEHLGRKAVPWPNVSPAECAGSGSYANGWNDCRNLVLNAAPPSPPIAERKDDALRQQVIATLTAIGLPSMMISGEGPHRMLSLLLHAAQGNPPAIGQSIGQSIGHGEPVHDMGCTG